MLLGPHDKKLTEAEDLSITQDRLCEACRYFRPRWKATLKYYALWIGILSTFYLYGWEAGWIHPYWKIIGGAACLLILGIVVFWTHALNSAFEYDKCGNRAARSMTDSKLAFVINRNHRCKFWELRESQRVVVRADGTVHIYEPATAGERPGAFSNGLPQPENISPEDGLREVPNSAETESKTKFTKNYG
jgi:hypothetical protein